jgi:release factor H-coupled RctB family protein
MRILDERTRVVAGPASFIESEAERQLLATAALAGVQWAVGMPDLHPGKGHPIGAAAYSEGVVYPHLVGGDIGCGMALFQTGLLGRKASPQRLADRLRGLEGPWTGDGDAWLDEREIGDRSFVSSLGTVGGGNHFVEVQAAADLLDEPRARAVGLDPDRLLLLVHSGSRGLGESILRAHTDVRGAAGLATTGDAASEAAGYLRAHDDAVRWASANRALLAHRFAAALGTEVTLLLDVGHNAVTAHERGWIHRKGAAPHAAGPVVIPGSRGAVTFLVEPTGDAARCGFSLAHGAGRKWTRTDARARMRERFRREELTMTRLGSAVICDDRALLFEEAPDAYKRIERVVGDLVEAGVCRPLATLRPVVTYKTRREP